MGLKQSTEVLKSDSDQRVYEDFLKSTIAENKIVMFSKTSCFYCTRAKQLLDDLKLDYKTIELDINKNCPNENCHKLSTVLVMQTRMRTLPQIFIRGKYIGGFEDLEALSKDKKSFTELLLAK